MTLPHSHLYLLSKATAAPSPVFHIGQEEDCITLKTAIVTRGRLSRTEWKEHYHSRTNVTDVHINSLPPKADKTGLATYLPDLPQGGVPFDS
jgi:hypothetical protein